MVLVLLVGASQIYLGAYWLTDVLAGYALGATWLAMLAALHRRGDASAAARGVSRAPVRRRVVTGPHRPADRLTH